MSAARPERPNEHGGRDHRQHDRSGAPPGIGHPATTELADRNTNENQRQTGSRLRQRTAMSLDDEGQEREKHHPHGAVQRCGD